MSWIALVVILCPVAQEINIWLDISLMFYPRLEAFELQRPEDTVGCIDDQVNVEIISPQLLTINRHYSDFSVSTLRKIDMLIAETMNVELTPTITWWLKKGDHPFVTYNLRQTGDRWGGKATVVGWNNCQIDLSHGNVTSLTLVRLLSGAHNSFGTYFHERAHTLGAIHGAYAAKFKYDYDNPNVVGPFDAYWWGEMARYAYMHGCHMFPSDTLDVETCTKIENIWSKN